MAATEASLIIPEKVGVMPVADDGGSAANS
jgi:hypothetical protein